MTKPLQTEYRTVVNEISKQTAASETVRDASGFFVQYIRPAPASPGDFVREFSRVFTEFPNIQLLQLVWAPVNDAAMTPPYAASTLQGTSLLQSASKAAVATPNLPGFTLQAAQPGTESDPLLSDGKFQAMIVEAVISPFNGDFRKASNDINIFIARINTLPGVTASLIVEPLDVRTTAAITANDASKTGVPPDAHFVLKLVRSMKASRS